MREPTNEVTVERDVVVMMRDGTALLTDIFHPDGVDDAPTILERTAYGRAAIGGHGAGKDFAARGYRYIIQACRGTDGSGGRNSFFAEADDGRDTADWIATQPWFNGRLGTYGMSYMGFTQWALASTRPPYLKAMAVALATTDRPYSWFTGGSISLEVLIPWNLQALSFNRPTTDHAILDGSADGMDDAVERRMQSLEETFDHLPLGDVLRSVTGDDLDLFQQQLAHASTADPFWRPLQHRALLTDWDIPVLLIDGWQDYPLPAVLQDHRALETASAPTWLRIGPGGHLGFGGEGALTDAPLEWFDRHLLDPEPQPRGRRVTVYIQGDDAVWTELPAWPPPSTPTTWYLHRDHGLARELPLESAPDVHTYDPADPTPSVGGIGMLTGGVVDNASLEARADVLVYSSAPLAEPTLVMGDITATIELSTTLEHFDVFVRLCDVHPDGTSFNVCDGFQRFEPGDLVPKDGVYRVELSLWPTAHRFGAGHSIRVQVSGGAHPVHARNLGTGEPPATAKEMRSAQRAVHHDPAHPSRIVLPHATNS